MKLYELLKILLGVMFITAAVLILLSVSGCKTQATRDKGEIDECYYARYMAREGAEGAAATYADRCIKVLRETGCVKVMKDYPGIYRDFNDCWKTRE